MLIHKFQMQKLAISYLLLMMLVASCVQAKSSPISTLLTRIDPGGPFQYRDAEWAPDSQEIVYVRRKIVNQEPVASNSEIFVVNVNTHETRQLTGNTFNDFSPSWSPDGKQIAYLRETTPFNQRVGGNPITDTIHIVNSDGTNDREIYICNNGCAGWLAWSPHNNKIAFITQSTSLNKTPRRGELDDIFVINPDGSDLHQITNGERSALQPQWSPDGRQIVFVRSDQTSIRILDIQTQIERAFVVGSLIGVQDPSWLPDQSAIVFSAMQTGNGLAQLYVLHLSDGSVSLLFDRNVNTDDLAIYQPGWSPDGTKLVLNSNFLKLYVIDAAAIQISK